MGRAHRLFQGIVVVGTALHAGACGKIERDDADSGSDGESSGGASGAPAEGATAGVPIATGGIGALPSFGGTASGATAGNGIGGVPVGGSGTGAQAGSTGTFPASDPGDCDYSQQFHCRVVDARDTPARTECRCDPASPLDPSQCSADLRFTCVSYDPPTGCSCVFSVTITR